LDDGDMGDDEGEGGDAQEDEEEPEDVLDGEAVEGEDDELPDQQEKVDTPDGKPNAEWLLLRSHPLYDCELEKSSIREYGKKGAWEPRFGDIFDELTLFRGPIKNNKQKLSELVGILKCKVKLFRKESEEDAEKAVPGEDPRYLDMTELKRNRVVEYQIPDVNENYPMRAVEVRVYLLKAFQMTPLQVLDGEVKSDCMVELRLGMPLPAAKWKWTNFYDPVKSLNPHFYRCATIKAQLPGPSQLHVTLLDNVDFMGLGLGDMQPFLFQPKLIGETVVDLEDRWFCEEWAQKTVNKPRETRDLFNPSKPGISVGKMMIMVDMCLNVDASDKPQKDVNIAGRQMPLEMRLIIWNLRNCAPKSGYTSDIKVVNNLLGWGKVKETDQDCGVKVSRNAMFNFRLKFKGIKFPSPDPTVPAKDFILKMSVWHEDLLSSHAIAEGLLPLQPLFLDCMQRNLGKASPDDMEIVTLSPDKDGDVEADEEGTKYPFKWFTLCHPGGPGCKTNKDFKQPGYDFVKNGQAEIQVTIQVLPRAKARAMPASNGFKAGPAKLKTPNRPPQPTNPIFNPEGCKACIVYTCAEAINKKKPCCCCLSCCVILVALLVGYVYLLDAGLPIAFF